MTQQTTTTYNSDGSYTVFTTDFVGDTTTQNYSAAGVILNDTWTKADGSSGADTFNADGSSSGTAAYANGTTSSYVNDGQGDITTKFFNSSGVETNDTWSKSDGSSGTDKFNADGSSSGTVAYVNGNTSTYTNDGKGDINTIIYNSSGGILSQTLVESDGMTDTTIENGAGAILGVSYQLGNMNNYSIGFGNNANTTVTGGNGSNSISISYNGIENDVITLGDGKDTISTGNGNVAMTVGGGNDSISLGTGTALVNAGNGNDTIVGAGADTITAGNGNDLLESGNGASVLTAGSGTDTLNGGSGVATLNGGSGTDTFIVGNSSDVITGQTANDIEESSVSVTAAANIVNLVGIGNSSIALTGMGTITANSGNDTLASAQGVVTMNGGSGSDTFIVDNAADVINVAANSGTNTVQSSIDYVLPSNIQNLTSYGTGNLTLTGNSLNNVITGNAGNDTLVAGTGNDTLVAGSGLATMVGGSGNDTFVVNNAGDAINEAANSGNNTVLSSINYNLDANIQNLTGSGSGNLVLTGNALNNVITGNAGADTLVAGSGNDTLVAGSGIDTMNGGSGSGTDTFVVDNAGDQVVAQSSDANLVQTSVSYTAPAYVQSMQAIGSAAITLTGNALADVLTANSGNDTLIDGSGLATLVGGSGNDTFVVNNTGDTITEAVNTGNNTEDTSVSTTLATNVQNLTGIGSAALILTGSAQASVITANSGADTLMAGSGLATLVGGSGLDTFVINNNGDVINEASSGTNSVEQTSLSTTLAANLQNLTGTGGANLTLTGNNLNDVIVSNTGIDTLVGGSGNDTFILNNASDVIVEAANTGNNTEDASFSTTLAANVQNLTGVGNASLILAGNLLANVITANSGADTLMAGSGLATLVGGAGRDTFVVNNSGDVINEAFAGTNSVEQTSVSATLAANLQNLTGTGYVNLTLTGNNMNDVITSNTGVDTLVGGVGNETFVVNNMQDVINTPLGNAANDTIVSSGNWNLAQGFVNLTGTGQHTQLMGNSGNDVLTDNGAYNTLVAGNGNDTLVGSALGDTLVGGAGNDTFVLNSTNDTIVDQSTGTNNAVLTSVGFSGMSNPNIQNVTGTGNNNMSLGVGINVVNGQPVAGNYVITSNQGVDTLQGGFGNNTFVVNNSSDYLQTQPAALNVSPTTVINTVNTVDTSVSYSVFQNVQNLTGTGSANIALIDSSNLNEVITSNSGVDTLTGGTGINTYIINNAWDVINAPYQSTSVIDTSVGYMVNPYVLNTQTLTGIGNANIVLSDNNQLNDVITSNSGIDTLTGGLASNTFVINNSADIITPVYNNGTTTIDTSVSYATSGNVQTMTGTGSANIAITDNGSANAVITSNSGIDTLVGGYNGDTFIVNNSADIVNSYNLASTVETSANYFLSSNVQNLTAIGSGNLLLQGNGLNDVITSNSGVDTLVGGAGNDTFVVNNSADQVYAQNNPNSTNTIDSSVSYVLPSSVQDLILTGSAAVTGTANGGNNLIVGNSGTDTLIGQYGTDVLEAGSGTSTLTMTNGAGALIAGAGNDTLNSGAGPSFIAAGAGNDAITLGTGYSVVAYNSGDGKTTIAAGTGSGDVLSLGHGIAYSNLSFSKSGNNLILNTGSGAITFTNWYSGTANQGFVTLQVLEQTASTYSPTSSNPLYNQGIEEFNFTQLVSQFNAALAAQPSLTSWNLMNGLLSSHLSGSNTAAFGGDLAYYDGINGNLTGMNLATANSTLSNSSFGRTTQSVDAWSGISNGVTKLH